LRAFLVQIKVLENHQNGKDTHIRGLKIYAKDERLGRGGMKGLEKIEGNINSHGRIENFKVEERAFVSEKGWFVEPGLLGEAELR
jgi:anaphase-promoting complex subunit 10